MYENRVLIRIFGPKRDDVTVEWRKVHYEVLNDLYSSLNIIRVIKTRIMRCAGHVSHLGENRGVYMVLVGKPEGKRPFGRPRRRREDNIKMYIQEGQDKRLPKLIVEWIPGERRKRGRPRKTWMEGVRAAMKTRYLEEDQWLKRRECCLGSGRRRQLSQDRKDR